MTNHEGMTRGFYHLNAAWYAEANQMPGRIDAVNFGFYDAEEGGTTGEMEMEWRDLSGRSTPRLHVFADGWHALAQFGDVLGRLAEHDDEDLTPDQFCALLTDCGFMAPDGNLRTGGLTMAKDKAVRISVKDVGQSFGCVARVYSVSGRRTVYETATYTHGANEVAYRAALLWAAENGYTVESVNE